MTETNLYYRTQLETKVSLLPEQINGNMNDHILSNLKAKIEGKTLDSGIILKVIRLIDKGMGVVDKSNLMGTTVYLVKYECFICSPTKNLEIICVVENIIKGYLIGKNGPVMVAIQFNNIDTQKFETSGNSIINLKTKNPINKGDHIKVSIISVNNNLGEKSIVTMCKLLSMASKEDIKSFEEDQILAMDGSVDDDEEFI